MKNKTLLLTFTAVLALGLAGCSKNEPVTPAADDANKAASSAADAADKTAEAAKVDAAKADQAAQVEAAKTAEAAKVAEAANNNKIQELIDKAKSFVAETNYTDASSVLQQLAGQSLSDEQTKLVNGLKDQIQTALAARAAANAAGDLPKQ